MVRKEPLYRQLHGTVRGVAIACCYYEPINHVNLIYYVNEDKIHIIIVMEKIILALTH